MTQTPEAMRARAARRRHLQQRQTVVFGTLIAALLAVGLLAGAMWSGVLPSPVSVAINDGGAEAPPATVAPPCPPADAKPLPYNEISANVLNGTDTQGLAARTAASLRGYGIQTGREQNGTEYGGVAQLTAGPEGLASAYTLAALFAESQITLDAREDASVDVLLGSAFEELIPEDEVSLNAKKPIPVPENCRPVETSSDEDDG